MSAVSLTALLIPHLVTVANAADVEIILNSGSVHLDALTGTTAHVATGVIVDGGFADYGFRATAHAWMIANDGIITGFNGINSTAGGTVQNNAGASITGTSGNGISLGILSSHTGAGTVINAGTISNGTSGDTVAIYGGGSITNLLGATISGNNGSNASSVSGGASRSVTNSGTIKNTGNGFATGVYVTTAGTSTVTNTATGIISGGHNGVYADGGTTLILDNAGSITSTRGPAVELAGANGTVTNSGIIETASTISGANGAALRFSGTGSITNTGTIRSTGSGVAIGFAGSAIHNLTLGTGSILGGIVVGGSGTDNLILAGTGTETIAKFSNFETLTMNGTDWTLNGSGIFSTTTTVQAGTLWVNGQLTSSAVSVQSGGTLTGNGTVVGNVTNTTGGNVRVDSGALAFNGNYIHQAGAFFTVGVTQSTNGVLAVTGTGHTATINGGTVRVLAGPGSYAPNTEYTILTSSGARSGMFDGVTSNLAFLDPSLTYDPNNVYLTLIRNSVDFSSIGGTRNQMAAGSGVQALGLGNAIVDSVLTLSADQARAAFDSVSGEIHPSLHSLMLNDSALVRDAIFNRERQGSGLATGNTQVMSLTEDDGSSALSYATKARKAKAPKWPVKAPAQAPVYEAWVQGYGNWGQINGDGNAAKLNYNSAGAVAGVDVTLNRNWRIGFAAGGGSSNANVNARSSSGTLDTVHIAAYGSGSIGDIVFRTGAAYSHHDVSTSRTISFPGFGDMAKANYNADTTQIFGEAARRLTYGWMTTEAFGNVAYVSVHSDAFTEAGGPAALSVGASTTAATFTTFGLRGQAPIAFVGPWTMIARGSLGWQHAFGDTTPQSLMSFAAAPSPFTIAGVPISRDMAVVEAGIDAAAWHNTLVSLIYAGRLASDASAHAVKANLTVKF